MDELPDLSEDTLGTELTTEHLRAAFAHASEPPKPVGYVVPPTPVGIEMLVLLGFSRREAEAWMQEQISE